MSGAATPRPSVRLVQTGLNKFNPSAGSAFLFVAGVLCVFPFGSKRVVRSGNLDTRQPFSYCYELSPQLRLESRYAHTAADLHVRSVFSNRAGLKNR